MTVKEYLKIHSGDDIQSIGIYTIGTTTDAHGRKTDILDAHVKTVDLVKYEDLEIDHVDLGIYDKQDSDFQGKPIMLKYIRACIYVK